MFINFVHNALNINWESRGAEEGEKRENEHINDEI